MRGILVFLGLLLVASPAFAAEYRYGKPIKHDNLTLVPVYPADAAATPNEDYLTFGEASDQKVIEVTELNGNTSDAQVEAVHVTSKAEKPILLLAGEVILGGKQDRIISTTTIVEPGTNKLRVAVFCVEQGRWDGRRAQFRASKKVAHGKLRKAAIFEENQQKVWDEVASQNKKSAASTSTGTYRATLDKKDVARKVKAMTAAVLPPLRADKNAIGVVAAVDGEVRSLDAFANPVLFAKLRDQLVESHVLAAVTSETPDEKPLSKDAITGLNKRIEDREDTKDRAKPSGEAENTYSEDDRKQKATTRTKSGDKVHEAIMLH